MAAAISSAAPSPWTRTGRSTTRIPGARRLRTLSISWMPPGRRGDDADRPWEGRQRPLARFGKQPLGSQAGLEGSKAACRLPTPVGARLSTISCTSPRAA